MKTVLTVSSFNLNAYMVINCADSGGTDRKVQTTSKLFLVVLPNEHRICSTTKLIPVINAASGRVS